MALILQPTYNEMSRQEIETHLEMVRAKRMQAVVTYHAGVNAAARHLIDKFRQRIANEYYQLEKAIAKLDKATAECEKRMENLEILMTEVHNAQGQIVETDDQA